MVRAFPRFPYRLLWKCHISPMPAHSQLLFWLHNLPLKLLHQNRAQPLQLAVNSRPVSALLGYPYGPALPGCQRSGILRPFRLAETESLGCAFETDRSIQNRITHTVTQTSFLTLLILESTRVFSNCELTPYFSLAGPYWVGLRRWRA